LTVECTDSTKRLSGISYQKSGIRNQESEISYQKADY